MESIKVFNGSRKCMLNVLDNTISVENSHRGYEIFGVAWKKLKHGIGKEINELSGAIFREVENFVRISHESWLSECVISSKSDLVSTALILAGVNTPDHENMYAQLRASVSRQNGNVAIVSPGSDTVSSRSLVASVVNQIMNPSYSEWSTTDVHGKNTKLVSCSSTVGSTYMALSEWYTRKTNTKSKASPVNSGTAKEMVPRPSRRSMSQPGVRTTAASRPVRGSLFPTKTQTPLESIKRRATTRSPIHPRLKLSMESAQKQTATGCPKGSKNQHTNPGPIVIILPQAEAISAAVLQDFIELTSIYVAGRTRQPSLPICLILGLSTTVEAGFEARLNASTLSRLRMHRFTVPAPAIFMESALNSLSVLYRRWLKNGLVETEAFNLTLNLLTGLSKDRFVQTLRYSANQLRNSESSDDLAQFRELWPAEVVVHGHARLMEMATSLDEWSERLDAAATTVDSKIITDTTPNQATASPKPQALTGTPLGGKQKLNLRGLRQHLQEIAANAASPANANSPRSRIQTEWDQRRGEFFTWLRTELSHIVPCPTRMPLHEVFYGPLGSKVATETQSSLALIRRRLNPTYRRSLHQALADPGRYLQIPRWHINSADSVNATLPDLCILYKLHMESGKMINLYDWLMAFTTVLGKEVDKNNAPEHAIQARFFRGLAELHMLGCIKSTRRKTDHVTRLTWNLMV